MKIAKGQLRRIIREQLGEDFFSDREANPHDDSMYGDPEGGWGALGEFHSEEEVLEYIDDIIDSSPPGTFTSWIDLAAELERDGMDKGTAERLSRRRLGKIWKGRQS